jgi:hypothetical protein
MEVIEGDDTMTKRWGEVGSRWCDGGGGGMQPERERGGGLAGGKGGREKTQRVWVGGWWVRWWSVVVKLSTVVGRWEVGQETRAIDGSGSWEIALMCVPCEGPGTVA